MLGLFSTECVFSIHFGSVSLFLLCIFRHLRFISYISKFEPPISIFSIVCLLISVQSNHINRWMRRQRWKKVSSLGNHMINKIRNKRIPWAVTVTMTALCIAVQLLNGDLWMKSPLIIWMSSTICIQHSGCYFSIIIIIWTESKQSIIKEATSKRWNGTRSEIKRRTNKCRYEWTKHTRFLQRAYPYNFLNSY